MSKDMSAKALVAPLAVYEERLPCMCCGNFRLYETGYRRSLCSAHTNDAELDEYLYTIENFINGDQVLYETGDQILYQWRDVEDPAYGQWFPAEIQTTPRVGYVHLNFIEIKLQVVAKKKQVFNLRELISVGQLAHIDMLEKKCFQNGNSEHAYYVDLFQCVTCPSVAHRTCFEEGCITNLDPSPEPEVEDLDVVYQCQSCVSMNKRAHDVVRPTLNDSIGVNDYESVRLGQSLLI